MHVAMIAFSHKCFERSLVYDSLLHSLLADPPPKSSFVFACRPPKRPGRPYGLFALLIECPGRDPLFLDQGAGREIPYVPDADAIGVLLAGGQGEGCGRLTRDEASCVHSARLSIMTSRFQLHQ